MTERYIGTLDEIRVIEQTLFERRKESIKTLKASARYLSLEDVLQEADRYILDLDLFLRLTHARAIPSSVQLIPRNRYFLWAPSLGDRGGFHGREPGGYCHFGRVGKAPFLGVSDRALRTFELVRCYLHDSIHASTYKTFRRDRRHGSTVYRECYGLNVRNANGVSYSSPEATKSAPQKINLNLLMDAVAQIYAGKIVRAGLSKDELTCNPDLAEICDPRRHPMANGCEITFNKEVVSPAAAFIDYWGGDELLSLIMSSMMSGDQHLLRAHFNTAMRHENAFELIFRQSAFNRSVGH